MITPRPWLWVNVQGARKLVAPTGPVLEARLSAYKPPSIVVKDGDALAIEAVPELVETLRTAELALRLRGDLGDTANRIKDLLAKIQA